MNVSWIDWVIVAVTILVCFVPALFLAKRSASSTTEFFASGRSVPWWLAGLSMVATTFSSDTPNWVTEQVRRYGVAGNWQWWAFVLTGIATVFFFARLWRRSGVLTDLEFYELRYSGKEASWVRGFRAVYLGLFFNCFIMGMVTLAACKIANILFGLAPWQTILLTGVLNVVFAAHSGLWGVLVIDMIQFFIKMTAVFAAAWFSLVEVGRRLAGTPDGWLGLKALVGTLATQQVVQGAGDAQPVMSMKDGSGQPILDMMPNFAMSDLVLMIFLMPIAISWWANWYPGAEPGGGSYIAQRMLASKSEKDSLGGTLFFNLAHYVLRPWPWIITALCSIIVYPDLASIKAAFPTADASLIGHDSAFPAMLKFLPVGFVGLMIGGLIAANSSTILTHLNWGSSYLVHDFYRRFIRRDATEAHYVAAGRLTTVFLFAFSALLSLGMSSAQQAFQVLLSIGAGTGLLYIARWFWWRVSAWCEIVAMAVSLITSLAVPRLMPEAGFAVTTIVQVGLTTIAWLITAFVGPATDRATLVAFVQKVKPSGPGWTAQRAAAGLSDAEVARENQIGTSLLGWVAGCVVIWSSLFAIGNFLYLSGDPSRTTNAWILAGVFTVSGVVLLQVTRKLWSTAK
ncbi:MAG TPA: Na+:solute symporter [Gemmatimonas aurantiaca]|uniref:Na+:solute symporter n=2 Tax=Gemmatimonas aurantiaca TaxID=173480 RepID=A0A3D4V9F2_9BACT|nr:sodium:solute symporter family protein [Gemmatimonas aurantiaca]BAH39064.1 putative sodium/solute symporter [Gemmatimonas aurantiaca T-27]HCT57362.1 Na+:solute symporter [Gemmatimonas aurantiaca]